MHSTAPGTRTQRLHVRGPALRRPCQLERETVNTQIGVPRDKDALEVPAELWEHTRG